MTATIKEWFSARELADAALPGLPTKQTAVIMMAKRNNWPSRPRAGRGGGREFHLSCLPPAARAALIERALGKNAVANVIPFRAPAAPKPDAPATMTILKQWQREILDARLFILNEVERLAASVGVVAAIDGLIAAGLKGDLTPDLARAFTRANSRKGAARTLSARSIMGWRAALKKDGQMALVPRPARAEKLAPPIWLKPLLDLYRQPQKPSLAQCFELLPDLLPPGAELPSLRTAHNWIKKIGNVELQRGRMGPRELKNLKPYIKRATDKLLPADVYTADGHTFDAEVAHPIHGKPFRPEITTVLDVATRRIVGWSVGLAESGWAVADALRHACEVGGVPAIFYVDNGSGYKNAAMDDAVVGLMARLQIEKRHSLPYNSQARGIIERAHRSVWVRAAKTLPTFMGADMDDEARKHVYKITRADIALAGQSRLLMPWARFVTWCEKTVTDYNTRAHSTLPGKISPDQAWAIAEAKGHDIPRLDAREADDLFRPHERRKVARGQVSIFSNTYFSSDLVQYHEQEVLVAYDIHDAQKVWVRDLDHRLIAVAEFEANRRDYFPQSAVEAAREKRAKGRVARIERQLAEIEAERAPVALPSLDGAAADDLRDLALAEIETAPAIAHHESAEDRFKRWMDIDARGPRNDAERHFHQGYAQTPEWAGQKMFFESFGLADLAQEETPASRKLAGANNL